MSGNKQGRLIGVEYLTLNIDNRGREAPYIIYALKINLCSAINNTTIPIALYAVVLKAVIGRVT